MSLVAASSLAAEGLDPARRPARQTDDSDFERLVPVHVVWELTLACNLKCQHCGSRAGRRRPNELSTAEALDLVDSLATLGTREVSLIGGEAYLRKDWLDIVRRCREHGFRTTIQTGARHLTPARIAAAADAGLQGIGVSIDGLADLHDRVRGVRGSYDDAIAALGNAKAHGLAVSVNTQIGAETIAHLAPLMDAIIDAGATHWQIQLTVAMGNAVDNDELLLQPHRLLELMPVLADLFRDGRDRGLLMVVGNNIGYYGPYEHLWRGFGDETEHWAGCAAGQTGIGIEADGTIKGCPSLATSLYAAGNIRDATLDDIWRNAEAMRFGRLRSVDELWGYCRTCYYADVCRAGCTWTSESLLGKRGNNPYCHHRVLDLAAHGRRERIVKLRDAPPESFAIGKFALIEEAIPGAATRPMPVVDPATIYVRHAASSPDGGTAPARLAFCHDCAFYVWPHETSCPHCGGDLADSAARNATERAHRRQLLDRAAKLLSAIEARVDAAPGGAQEAP